MTRVGVFSVCNSQQALQLSSGGRQSRDVAASLTFPGSSSRGTIAVEIVESGLLAVGLLTVVRDTDRLF